jgi:uncharacterized protein (DUF1330 family)
VSHDDPFAPARSEIGALAAEHLAARADEGPILMLNLLRFTPDGGRELYNEYGAANAPLVERFGVKISVAAVPAEALIGRPYWDLVLIVEYPTRQTFIDMLNTELYVTNEAIRTRAVEDSELHVMDPLAF